MFTLPSHNTVGKGAHCLDPCVQFRSFSHMLVNIVTLCLTRDCYHFSLVVHALSPAFGALVFNMLWTPLFWTAIASIVLGYSY